MIKTIHGVFDVGADLCLRSRFLRSGFRYICNRFDGFQYGSYSLGDEAALALSFTPLGGGLLLMEELIKATIQGHY